MMLADLIHKGGLPLIAVLAMGALHMLAVIAQLILCRKVDLSPLLWSGVLAIVLGGAIGSVAGQITSFAAAGYASAEMKQTLIASGISMALYTAEISLMVAIVAVSATGLASTLARNLVRKPSAEAPPEDPGADVYTPG